MAPMEEQMEAEGAQRSTDQPTDQPTNRSTDQPINRSTFTSKLRHVIPYHSTSF
jgi:hypothetical protein